MSKFSVAMKRFGGFVKRNAVYFLIILCIASVATVIALAVTRNSALQNPDASIGDNTQDEPVVKPDEPVVNPTIRLSSPTIRRPPSKSKSFTHHATTAKSAKTFQTRLSFGTRL